MAQKSAIKMSFQVDTSEEATPQPPPVQQQQQPQMTQRIVTTTTEEKQYTSGRFDHLKVKMDAQNRYDAAFSGMARRAIKAGDQFEVERKAERDYEADEKLGTPQRVIDWIRRVFEGQDVPMPNGTESGDIQCYLRDGVMLCKLLNRLLKHAGMNPIGYKPVVKSGFVGMNNLSNFLDGIKRYGVPVNSFFDPSDLHEGKKGKLRNVVQCLNALGCVANHRKFEPAYEEFVPPKADYCKDECYD